jgi:hypothetical protein
MAIESWTNLEKTSEKNEVNVEVFVDNKYSKFTHIFKIPFKKLEEPIKTVSIYEVIDTFSDVIIDALEKRMEACVSMVNRNLFNIVESDEFHILFKKEDGSYHSFNHPSFKIMQEAVTLIKEEKSKYLTKAHCDQIIKALYWIEKPAPRNGISFGNLISACMEIIIIPLS